MARAEAPLTGNQRSKGRPWWEGKGHFQKKAKGKRQIAKGKSLAPRRQGAKEEGRQKALKKNQKSNRLIAKKDKKEAGVDTVFLQIEVGGVEFVTVADDVQLEDRLLAGAAAVIDRPDNPMAARIRRARPRKSASNGHTMIPTSPARQPGLCSLATGSITD